MDLSKIKIGDIPNKINAVIEIPYGSNIKYEIDKDSGAIMVDRVMASAMFYPATYGFIANTLADDGDPVDILVLNEYPIQAGAVIPCRLIGVLIMEDESGMDEKLLAVPNSKISLLQSFSFLFSYTIFIHCFCEFVLCKQFCCFFCLV